MGFLWMTEPAWGFFYHLLALFVLEAGLGMAFNEWRTTANRKWLRLLWAFAFLLGSRLVLMGVAFLAWRGLLSPAYWVPPLARFLDTGAIAFLVWAFLLPLKERELFSRWFLPSNLALMALAYLVLAPLWVSTLAAHPGLSYYGHPQEVPWLLWQLLLTGVGITLAYGPMPSSGGDEERPLLMGAFVSLLVGKTIGLACVFGAPPLPGGERLAELVALVLFVTTVYRRVIAGLRGEVYRMEEAYQRLSDEREVVLYFMETLGKLSSLELPELLAKMTEGLAEVLKADQCAIALPEEGEGDRARLAAIYNPARKGRGEMVTFPLQEQQILQQAIWRKSQVVLNEGLDNVQLRLLYALMGSEETGPLLVQPLVGGEEAIGALVIGRARSKRPFSSKEAHLCQSLSRPLALAVKDARLLQQKEAQVERLAWLLRSQEAEAGERRKALEAELRKKEEEIGLLSARLQTLEMQAKKGSEEAQRLKKRWQTAKAEAEELSKRLEEATKAREKLEEEAKATREERQRLKGELTRLVRWTDELPVGVLVADEEARIRWVNDTGAQLLSTSPEELLGRSLKELGDEASWDEALNSIQTKLLALKAGLSLAEGLQPVQLTWGVGERFLQARIRPQLDENQNLNGWLIVVQDVTAEKESREKRDEALISLSEELRTPMTSVVGYVDLLLGEAVGVIGEMQRKFLQRIKANVERMRKTIEDLIEVLAIDTGRLKLAPRPIHIAEVIEEAILRARAQLEEKELRLELEVPEDLPLVMADPSSIRQVMTNLLNNACLCSPPGSRIRIRATVEREGEDLPPYLVVSVTDSGGGIAPDDEGRVFERFSKANHPLIAGLGETGAGLSIVKTLIEAHGGRVWMESQMGVGSTFSFVLPTTMETPKS